LKQKLASVKENFFQIVKGFKRSINQGFVNQSPQSFTVVAIRVKGKVTVLNVNLQEFLNHG
jgi:hypothetical protein